MNLILLLVLLALLLVAGTGFAHFLNQELAFGLGAGLILALIPWLVRSFSDMTTAMKSARVVILTLLLLISIFSAQQVLYPLIVLQTANSKMQNVAVMVLATIGLYVLYLLIMRTDAFLSKQTLNRRLSILFSGPSLLFSLTMAVILTTFTLIVIDYIHAGYPQIEFLSKRLMERGMIPPITVMLFYWGGLILLNKAYMLYRETLALKKENADDDSILAQSYYQNLKDSGQTEIDTYVNFLWNESSNFYIIPRYINWAIPILGFIGTVLGISLAADGIQRIIGSQQGLAQMSSELGEAISPLGIAFDTTLVALSLSIVLALAQLILQRWENRFMTEYEHSLRSMPIAKL